MIFIDDTDTFLVARSRREAVDALLDHLPAEPTLSQLTKIAAGCLDCLETDIVIKETG